MSSFIDKIITKLDSKFSEQPSPRNSVISAEGDKVRVCNELWQESPVLREHLVNDRLYKMLAAPKTVLVALMKTREEGTFPTGIQESYELLAVASELELQYLTSKCLENLCKINGMDASVDFPPGLSVDTIMRVFKVLLDTPPRTAEVYERQLLRIARHCANSRYVMTNAMNVLKQGLEKFKLINLEGIPVTFGARTVPIAIYKRMGKLQTAVIVGGEVKPVNIFGNRIDLENITVERDFYLKYGVYLLYWLGGYVFKKSLQDDALPFEVLSNCYIFITRGNFVFAVQDENNCRSISLWTDDERFEKIYQSEYEITIVQFDYDSRVLAVQLLDGKLILFRLENLSLSLLEEIDLPDVVDVHLSGCDMFLVRKINAGSWIETHRVPSVGQLISEQPDNGTLTTKSENPIAWSSVRHFGGSYFLSHRKRLELFIDFPTLDHLKTLMTDGECYAMSELWMFP